MHKIGLISSHGGLNGAAKMVETLARGLADQGHQVRLYHREGAWLAQQSLPESVDLRPVDIGVRMLNKAEISRVRAELLDWGAACLHSHGTSADRFNGCVRLDGQLAGVATAHARVLHLHWRKHDLVIAPSNYTLAWYQKLRLVRHGRSCVIANAMDKNAICPIEPEQIQPLRAELGLPGNKFLILMIGTVTERKNQSAAIPILSELISRGVDADLVVVGQGNGKEAAKLQRLADSKGLRERVHLLGQRSDIGAYVGASNLVLSTSRDEQASVSLIETLAGGRTAVSSDVGSAREVVRDGSTGMVFNLNNTAPATDFIVQCASDPAFARRCNIAARQSFEDNLTTPSFVKAHVAAYEVAVERNSQR